VREVPADVWERSEKNRDANMKKLRELEAGMRTGKT
jgi:hypothetical protein